jgi:uncharacterized membrane protein YkvA (DUF1232 family)
VPWYAKVAAAVVAAYALSPIDLIPDFVPVLGYLDDAVIVPLGIVWAVKLVPAALMHEFREATEIAAIDWVGRWGAAAIVALWIVSAVVALRWGANVLR